MKIAYLFGAGASRQALPIVNEMPKRIKETLQLLKNEQFRMSETERYDDLSISESKAHIQKTLIADFEWLLTHLENHASIDTFAKKLFIKRKRDELKKLKTAFSVYLVIEQLINKADKRYDSFYASLLNQNVHDFPSNLRILSWNYDSQFEIAFSDYTDDKRIDANKSSLNVITKHTYDRPRDSNFCLIKLNGTTNILQYNGSSEYFYINEYEYNFTMKHLDKILRNYAAIRFVNDQLFSGLSFAWERFGKVENDIVHHAKKETFDVEVLVVIGYSFPFFNREIDREIIGNMTSLRKVYFQAPDAEILKERFLSIRNDLKNENMLVRFDVGQFLLPNEM